MHERSGDDRDHRPDDRDSDNPDLDYSYCRLRPAPRGEPVAVVAQTADVLGNGARTRCSATGSVAPLVRWQSGNRSTVTTGVDNALTGMGEPARRADARRSVTATARSGNYLNRAAFAAPAPGTYSTLEPFSIVNPSRLQNDLALTRTFKHGRDTAAVPLGDLQRDEPRELQRTGDGAEQRELRPDPTAGGPPRIMQFALKFAF